MLYRDTVNSYLVTSAKSRQSGSMQARNVIAVRAASRGHQVYISEQESGEASNGDLWEVRAIPSSMMGSAYPHAYMDDGTGRLGAIRMHKAATVASAHAPAWSAQHQLAGPSPGAHPHKLLQEFECQY